MTNDSDTCFTAIPKSACTIYGGMKYLGNNANHYMIAVGPATSQTTSEYIYHRDCIDEVNECLSQVDGSKPRVIDSEEIAEDYQEWYFGNASII